MKQRRREKCRHCRIFFFPDHRNVGRQQYCNRTPECRRASKAASQARWLENNPDYFKGSAHVERVREWRQSKRGRSCQPRQNRLLQDDCQLKKPSDQPVIKHKPPSELVPVPPEEMLQDGCNAKNPVLVGLIVHLTGVLQDEIDPLLRRLYALGQDVLNAPGSTPSKGGQKDDPQSSALPGAYPGGTQAVQLGGPAPGP